MQTSPPSMTDLFEQLGLDSDEASIAEFIKNHQLPTEISIFNAEYWTEGQKQFLNEKIFEDDGDWSLIIDQLSQSLHEKPEV